MGQQGRRREGSRSQRRRDGRRWERKEERHETAGTETGGKPEPEKEKEGRENVVEQGGMPMTAGTETEKEGQEGSRSPEGRRSTAGEGSSVGCETSPENGGGWWEGRRCEKPNRHSLDRECFRAMARRGFGLSRTHGARRLTAINVLTTDSNKCRRGGKSQLYPHLKIHRAIGWRGKRTPMMMRTDGSPYATAVLDHFPLLNYIKKREKE